jgi:hypothetical protein
VRFEIHGPLESAGCCHCTRCQRRTGTAASAQARVRAGALRIVAGEELLRSYAPPDGGFVKEFCGLCGSSLFSRDPEDASMMAVRLGAFDGDPGIRPTLRQWVGSAAVWEAIPDDGLPRYDGPRPGATWLPPNAA